jgi:hypothetical protein
VADLRNQAAKRKLVMAEESNADVVVAVLDRNYYKAPSGPRRYQNYMTVTIEVSVRASSRGLVSLGKISVTRNWWRGAAGALANVIQKICNNEDPRENIQNLDRPQQIGAAVNALANGLDQLQQTCSAYASQWFRNGSEPWRQLYIYCLTH